MKILLNVYKQCVYGIIVLNQDVAVYVIGYVFSWRVSNSLLKHVCKFSSSRLFARDWILMRNKNFIESQR